MQCSLIRKRCLIKAESFASRHESKERITSIKSGNIRLREVGFIKREFHHLLLRPPFSAFLKKIKVSFEFRARIETNFTIGYRRSIILQSPS